MSEQQQQEKEAEAIKASEAVEARMQDKEEMEKKLRTTARSLDECQRRLEASGINAVTLKEWIAKEDDRDEDITMLEQQLSEAMDKLKCHKDDLKAKIGRNKASLEFVNKARAQLDEIAKQEFSYGKS